jgi:rubrerythrin
MARKIDKLQPLTAKQKESMQKRNTKLGDVYKPLKKYPLDAKNAKPSTIQQIATRFNITAREARDIATAVGSAAQAIRKSPQEGMPVKKIVKNVAKQVKETGTAAAKGKKGTSAYVVSPNKASQSARKAAGNEGFVTYKVKGSKNR